MFPIGFQPTLQWYVYLKGCFLAIIGSFLVAGSEGRIAESSMSANSSQPRAHKQQGERRLSLWTFARAPCTLQAFQTQGRRGLLLQKRLLTLLLAKGERGDKGLLPTPLNISDKNNDGANLTATCISVSIPLAACQADRATPLSRSGSVQSSDCMEQSHTCLQKKKMSPGRGRSTIALFQRGSDGLLCQMTKNTPGMVPALGLPRRTLWGQGCGCRELIAESGKGRSLCVSQ